MQDIRRIFSHANDLTEEIFPSVVEAFFQWVSKTPDAVAYIDEKEYTYHELAQAARLISQFIASTYAPQAVIAVEGVMCFEVLAVIIGILNSGCVLLSLNEDLPLERKTYMLREAKAC